MKITVGYNSQNIKLILSDLVLLRLGMERRHKEKKQNNEHVFGCSQVQNPLGF